jgi:hypothetical protein
MAKRDDIPKTDSSEIGEYLLWVIIMRPKGKLPDWNQHGAGKWPICVRIGVMGLLPLNQRTGGRVAFFA